jgi:hypothetical protein
MVRILRGCGRVNRQCMDALFEFLGENAVDHAVPFDAALSIEGLGHDMNPEMCLAAWPPSCVSLVLRGLIHHLHMERGESLDQLFSDVIAYVHKTRLLVSRAVRQWS